MLSMPFAAPSVSLRPLRVRALGLLAALATAAVPGIALADTGGPLPQGYTSDVAAGAQPSQAPPVQQVSGEDDADDEYADTDPSALSDFHDTLDPHGTWTEDPTYGTIWVPSQSEVGADFAPYQSSGQWAVGDDGEWAWQSDYDWGYVPFHYGRWVWAGNAWGWIPGRTYAPAWVTWRVGDDGYLGWAPLPPTWYWADGVAVGLWSVPYAAYCFVPTSYVFAGHVSNYVVRDRGRVQSIAQGTRPYHPATPSVGGHGAAGHAPQRSPSFQAAHIPASAIPQNRVMSDRRAMAFATRSSTAAVHRSAPARTQLSNVAPASRGGNAWHNTYDGFGRSRTPGYGQQAAPSAGYRGSPAPSSGYSGYRGSPAPSAGFRQAPAASQGFREAPSGFRRSPSVHASPSFHAAPSFPTAPSPSFHSAPAPSFHSAPAPSFHPPSSTVSRPAAPRPSVGGVHVGGGGRHR